MTSEVRYRGFTIIKTGDRAPWRVFRADGERVPGDFWTFAEARQEVDAIKVGQLA